MFCPKCGKADQTPETYCRQCGTFLPDLTKPAKKEHPASEHIKANLFFSALTILTSFTLATLLYVFMAFRPDTHVLVYVTAGFLLAIGGWHVQTLVRSILLRKQLKRWGRLDNEKEREIDLSRPARHELDEADLSSVVPASVTESTTRNLAAPQKRSS